MPLIVNLHELQRQALHLRGEIPADELELNQLDELIHATGPVRYDLNVEKLGQSLLVQGLMKVELQCECVRCLKRFACPLEVPEVARELPLQGEEAAPVSADAVDLTPFLREDILLALPQHPLCDPGCAGLLNARLPGSEAPPGGEARTTPSPWATLDKLKF